MRHTLLAAVCLGPTRHPCWLHTLLVRLTVVAFHILPLAETGRTSYEVLLVNFRGGEPSMSVCSTFTTSPPAPTARMSKTVAVGSSSSSNCGCRLPLRFDGQDVGVRAVDVHAVTCPGYHDWARVRCGMCASAWLFGRCWCCA